MPFYNSSYWVPKTVFKIKSCSYSRCAGNRCGVVFRVCTPQVLNGIRYCASGYFCKVARILGRSASQCINVQPGSNRTATKKNSCVGMGGAGEGLCV